MVPIMKHHTAAEFVRGDKDTIDAKELINLRALYRAKIGGWRPWDLVAQRRPRLNLRMLPTLRLPVDDLFEITSMNGKRRPGGLEICAALGSAWARDQLDPSIPKFGPLDAGDRIATEYFKCVGALLDAPEPDPSVFGSAAP